MHVTDKEKHSGINFYALTTSTLVKFRYFFNKQPCSQVWIKKNYLMSDVTLQRSRGDGKEARRNVIQTSRPAEVAHRETPTMPWIASSPGSFELYTISRTTFDPKQTTISSPADYEPCTGLYRKNRTIGACIIYGIPTYANTEYVVTNWRVSH